MSMYNEQKALAASADTQAKPSLTFILYSFLPQSLGHLSCRRENTNRITEEVDWVVTLCLFILLGTVPNWTGEEWGIRICH